MNTNNNIFDEDREDENMDEDELLQQQLYLDDAHRTRRQRDEILLLVRPFVAYPRKTSGIRDPNEDDEIRSRY